MINKSVLALSGMLTALFIGACTEAPQPQAPGATARPFPDVPVRHITGEPTRILHEASGRVAVVDLWASWCKACEAEHSVLEELSATYDSGQLLVAGVNIGEEQNAVKRYLETHEYSYPVYLDPEFQLADALDETELPVVFIVSSTGEILHRTTKVDQRTLETIRAELNRAHRQRSVAVSR